MMKVKVKKREDKRKKNVSKSVGKYDEYKQVMKHFD